MTLLEKFHTLSSTSRSIAESRMLWRTVGFLQSVAGVQMPSSRTIAEKLLAEELLKAMDEIVQEESQAESKPMTAQEHNAFPGGRW